MTEFSLAIHPVTSNLPLAAVVPSSSPTEHPSAFNRVGGQSACDKTSQAVLAFLTADPDDTRETAAWRDPWRHLIAILRKAMRGKLGQRLFLPCDRYLVQFLDDHGHQQKSEELEDENSETTRWIETWLAEKLAPWRGKSDAELFAAASRGVFRNLANECRYDLMNEITRRNNPRRNPGAPLVSLDAPLDPLDEKSASIADYVVRPDVVNPIDWIQGNHRELQREGVYDVMAAVAAHFLLGEKAATTTVSEHCGIGLRQAQRVCRKALSRIRTELRDTPIIRELYGVIERTNRKRYGLPELASILSPA